jgi:dipeptidyl aminopeptidase/acylaminoacyl peptidase
VSRSGGRGTLFIVNADGTNLRVVAKSLNVTDAPSWSPDAKWLAVAANDGNGTKVYKAPVDSGSPVLLTSRPLSNPVWSPDGRFIICTTPAQPRLTAVTPEGKDFPLNVPELAIRNGVRDVYHFLPSGDEIVVRQGQYRNENFWLANIKIGQKRQITDLKPGFSIDSFDVSPDGQEILFDRARQNGYRDV